MEEALPIIITLIVCGLLSSGAMLLTVKTLQGRVARSVGPEFDSLSARIKRFDVGIAGALGRTEGMAAFDELGKLETSLRELQARFETENANLKTMEKRLNDQQAQVDRKEAKQNELKQGREEFEQIADEIRANRDRLDSEAERLKKQLVESKVQLDSLSVGVGLTPEQQELMNDLASSLQKTQQHMNEMNDLYLQATQRFTNVQAQYAQLELEYRNLLEKQLSGQTG